MVRPTKMEIRNEIDLNEETKKNLKFQLSMVSPKKKKSFKPSKQEDHTQFARFDEAVRQI